MDYITITLLSLIVILVLILPISVHKVEENLEAFLFVMGVSAVSISGMWNWHLVFEAAKEPLPITAVVITLGFAFMFLGRQFRYGMLKTVRKMGLRPTIFILVLALGFFSSVITAIVAAVMLSEAVSILGLNEKNKVKVIVFACFAIGLGAILTPIGEPLSTIATSKLKGPPHHADFFFLFKILAPLIVPGVILTSIMAAWIKQRKVSVAGNKTQVKESPAQIVLRGFKIFLFIAALVFLGAGLRPLAEVTVFKLSDPVLYWVNSVSAILDNATLAAIEIVPEMTTHTIMFLLMGLIVAGGLLIPGNIPNIICASKLKIKSGAWAKTAIPFGVALMAVYFIIMMMMY